MKNRLGDIETYCYLTHVTLSLDGGLAYLGHLKPMGGEVLQIIRDHYLYEHPKCQAPQSGLTTKHKSIWRFIKDYDAKTVTDCKEKNDERLFPWKERRVATIATNRAQVLLLV